MQLEKEKEFKQQMLKLEELNQEKLKYIKEEQKNASENKDNKATKKCTTCKDSSFYSNEDFRSHFKSELHLFNLKRKANNQTTLSEIEHKAEMMNINFE